jgi:hypothetical protein
MGQFLQKRGESVASYEILTHCPSFIGSHLNDGRLHAAILYASRQQDSKKNPFCQLKKIFKTEKLYAVRLPSNLE